MPDIDIPAGSGLAVYELIEGDPERLEAALRLYAALMPKYAHYMPRMRHRAQLSADHDPRFLEHLWLLEVDGDPAALTAFKYVPGRHCGLGIDLVVSPDYRAFGVGRYRRLAEFVNASVVAQVHADARAAGHPTPVGLVVEVAAPELVAHYRQYGLVELPVEYLEPSFPPQIEAHTGPVDPEELTFSPMHLGIFPTVGTRFDLSDRDMLADLVMAFLVDHYRLPGDHWAVRRALESLWSHERKRGEGT